MPELNNIKDIEHVLYINLEHRTDRKQHIENQLKIIGINKIAVERFNAIKMETGRVGCSLSQLKCIQTAKENNWDHVLVLEDDALFLKPNLFVRKLNKFLENHKEWDVLFLGGNVVPPYKEIDNCCIKIRNCQCATAYLVKSHYYDKLIQNFKESIKLLMKYPDNHREYAVDKYWFKLQEVDNWYMIIPPLVVQREDYSDIEYKNVNYRYLMTDLEKKWLYQPIMK